MRYSLFVKMSEKVVAPYGKLYPGDRTTFFSKCVVINLTCFLVVFYIQA